ncbi:conjugal transfer protein [Lentibacillus cibarius]|uniref:Conjugal transfer protein n=1 Tax=Lentibacillus cibarius TaxID=2583219 RepID=A0A5S3R6S6_9BACI|nr:conjugal transfer protein [Lentibacillus cibarius]TMN20943.1 conjugal transfer protein [Lentibacillus cibarius]
MKNIQKKKENKENIKALKRFMQKMKVFFSTKPKKEKPARPKSYLMRKLGVITFWLLFSFMFLVVFVNITSNINSGAEVKQSQPKPMTNPATKPEAIQFAKDFTKNYFTWKRDSWKVREKRLSNFLAKGLDSQAGLVKDSLKWDASVQHVSLQNVEKITENKAHIIFETMTKMSREVQVKNENKKDKEKAKTKTETKEVANFFAVPITYNGTSYGVYDLPFITNVDSATTVTEEANNYRKDLEAAKASKEVTNIKNFLDTFFTSYAKDSEDRLSYILTDEKHQNGLQGALNFVEVGSADVFHGEKQSKFIVIADVTMEDPETSIQFDTVYRLVVTKEQDHYLVSNLKADQAIKELASE